MELVSFNNVSLFTVTIQGKPWTRAKEVCKALEYSKNTKTDKLVKRYCSEENYAHKWELIKVPTVNTLLKWPSHSRKDNYYVSEEGMYELAFTSYQDKAKDFRKH